MMLETVETQLWVALWDEMLEFTSELHAQIDAFET